MCVCSRNHPMFGSVREWLHKRVAGLQQDEGSVAYRCAKLTLPHVAISLSSLHLRFKSYSGTFEVRWVRQAPTRIALNLTVPPNCAAIIVAPDALTAVWVQTPTSAREYRYAEFETPGRVASGLYQFLLEVR